MPFNKDKHTGEVAHEDNDETTRFTEENISSTAEGVLEERICYHNISDVLEKFSSARQTSNQDKKSKRITL